jgi:hypothetical protein
VQFLPSQLHNCFARRLSCFGLHYVCCWLQGNKRKLHNVLLGLHGMPQKRILCFWRVGVHSVPDGFKLNPGAKHVRCEA